MEMINVSGYVAQEKLAIAEVCGVLWRGHKIRLGSHSSPEYLAGDGQRSQVSTAWGGGVYGLQDRAVILYSWPVAPE